MYTPYVRVTCAAGSTWCSARNLANSISRAASTIHARVDSLPGTDQEGTAVPVTQSDPQLGRVLELPHGQ
jgi:hypothetical protein